MFIIDLILIKLESPSGIVIPNRMERLKINPVNCSRYRVYILSRKHGFRNGRRRIRLDRKIFYLKFPIRLYYTCISRTRIVNAIV